ncbi:MAG: DNA recombination protein RmuC [SAR202 cluster bacterium]|nr:DNA recombination protein RmuC [SAR202 cluster bacterium]
MAVEGLVRPLGDALSEVEKSRKEAYGALRQQLEDVTKGQQQLTSETSRLVQALKHPQARGRWGELTLRRVAELSGMVERCDFVEQQTISSADGLLRPDMVIYLPSERRIAVDAKTPLDAYLQAIEAQGDDQRRAALERHAKQLRDRIRELSAKSYWDSLGYTPEFVVLFLPGEFFLTPALEHEPNLLEEGMKARVVVATPSTLISLLYAVAYGWRQEQLTENARRISDLGRELYDRLATWAEHLGNHRRSLEKAVETFNEGIGSLERMVLPSARKFKELGVSPTKKAIPEIETISTTLRIPSSVVNDEAENPSAQT